MKWTTEPPTEPGYYWLKYIDKEDGITTILCRLRKAKVHLKVTCWVEPSPVGFKGIFVKENLPGFIKDVKPLGWAGPIEEPEE